MQRGLFVLLIGAAGCGRLGFGAGGQAEEDAAVDGTGGGEAGVDAYVGCAPRTPPDPLTVSGVTFRYTTFDNDRASMAGATARVVSRANGATLDETTSNGAGAYSLQVATGGQPADVVLEVELAGHFKTRVVPDAALDADVQGPYEQLWALGDVPLWDSGLVDGIYAAAGTTHEAGMASVNVAVRDCAGTPVGGVTVTADPPATVAYLAPDGVPSASRIATVAPFAHALLLNVTPGPVRITGTKEGATLLDLMLDVPTGDVVTLTILRVLD